MISEDKVMFVTNLIKKDEEGKSYLTIGDLYDIYNKCKLCSLIKILKDEGEVTFYEEDDEEGLTDTEGRNLKVFM